MQVLTVCRFEAEWAVRDVMGEAYGRSPDIRNTYESAQQLARRIGARVEFSPEAERHYKAVIAGRSVDTSQQLPPKSPRRFRALLTRFVRRGRRGPETNS